MIFTEDVPEPSSGEGRVFRGLFDSREKNDKKLPSRQSGGCSANGRSSPERCCLERGCRASAAAAYALRAEDERDEQTTETPVAIEEWMDGLELHMSAALMSVLVRTGSSWMNFSSDPMHRATCPEVAARGGRCRDECLPIQFCERRNSPGCFVLP